MTYLWFSLNFRFKVYTGCIRCHKNTHYTKLNTPPFAVDQSKLLTPLPWACIVCHAYLGALCVKCVLCIWLGVLYTLYRAMVLFEHCTCTLTHTHSIHTLKEHTQTHNMSMSYTALERVCECFNTHHRADILKGCMYVLCIGTCIFGVMCTLHCLLMYCNAKSWNDARFWLQTYILALKDLQNWIVWRFYRSWISCGEYEQQFLPSLVRIMNMREEKEPAFKKKV